MSTIQCTTATSRTQRRSIAPDTVACIILLGIVGFLVTSWWMLLLLNAPTIDPADHDDTYPYRTKIILNAGGLGWPYWEGAECLVDLLASFDPLGLYEGQPVARYTPRVSWRSWWQCPPGTLVYLDEAALHAWRTAATEKVRQDAERRAMLRRLTEQAGRP